MVISTIFYVIIAVIFLVVFSSIVYNFLASFPTVRGAIGEPTYVVCFGGGDDQAIHCLTKENGTEVFYFKAAAKWSDNGAESTPTLTEEGIYFGVNDHICAYNVAGQAIWECQDYGKKITSSTGIGKVHVCFGNKEKYYCLEKANGLLAREFGEPDEPFISVDDQSTYYANKFEYKITLETGKSIEFAGKTIKMTSSKTAFAWVDVGSETYKMYPNEEYTAGDVIIKVDDVTASSITFNVFQKNRKFALGKYKLDRAEDDWVAPLQYPVISEITISDDKVCFGTFKDGTGRLICLDKAGNSKLNHAESGKITTPAIDGDNIYVGFGKYFYKFYQPLGQSIWGKRYDNDVSTGIELVEGFACFAEGPTLHCFDVSAATPKETFSVTAPTTWDFRETESKPLILDDVVYFAMGDYVCAYATNSTGTFTGDEGAKWCVDFDEKIATDIVGLPSKKFEVPA